MYAYVSNVASSFEVTRRTRVHFLFPPRLLHLPPITSPFILSLLTMLAEECTRSSSCNVPPFPDFVFHLSTHSIHVHPLEWDTKSHTHKSNGYVGDSMCLKRAIQRSIPYSVVLILSAANSHHYSGMHAPPPHETLPGWPAHTQHYDRLASQPPNNRIATSLLRPTWRSERATKLIHSCHVVKTLGVYFGKKKETLKWRVS
jgi:hypothetical protein